MSDQFWPIEVEPLAVMEPFGLVLEEQLGEADTEKREDQTEQDQADQAQDGRTAELGEHGRFP